MTDYLARKPWWNYLEEDLQELLEESFLLLEIFESRRPDAFHDYSFVVFPAAKAYEGFLKKVFLDRGFITKDDYFGQRFRIGKALNPELEDKYRQESVYDKIVTYCGGEELAKNLWETWKTCRNLVFHWFPDEKRVISLSDAKERVMMVVTAIDMASRECKIG